MDNIKPKHLIISDILRDKILQGYYPFGERLSSENELSKEFSVSRQTVRQAIGTLENEGLLLRVKGSGTFVADNDFKIPKKTMNIGVIITYLDDYIFPSIVQGIESVLTKNNYTMSFGITYNKIENEAKALNQMLRIGVDGLIVEGTKSALPNPNSALYKKLRSQNIPSIFINGYYDDIGDGYVIIDDVKAGETVCQELINNGHTKIGGLFKSDDMQGPKRYQGFIKKMFANQIEINDESVIWYTTEDFDYIFSGDYDKVILNRFKSCTAIICYNDQVAVNLIALFKRNNISVPQDMSIISFDNSSLAKQSLYNLTSFQYPSYEVGKQSAEALLTKISNPKQEVKYRLETELVIRKSVNSIK